MRSTRARKTRQEHPTTTTMMSIPTIGITCGLQLDPQPSAPPAYLLRRNYTEAIAAAAAVPLIVAPLEQEPLLRALYARLDGVLLTGGEDIDPRCYRQHPHATVESTDPARDALELALTRWALEDGKPLLGICRGIQMLNVTCGGTLYQDIPDQYPTPINHMQSKAVPDWADLVHDLQLAPDSALADILGTTCLPTNSLHHQAVDVVGSGLRVTGHAPDGLIEALEGTGAGFVLAVQSHPEALWATTGPRWQALFAAFVDACRSWHDTAR